jgi:hypothetical protein
MSAKTPVFARCTVSALMLTADQPSSTIPRIAFSVKEAAAAFGKKPLWLYRKVYKGEVRVLSPNGQLMIPARELEKLVAKTRVYQPRKRGGRPKNQTKAAA